jgi:hypothetical protein
VRVAARLRTVRGQAVRAGRRTGRPAPRGGRRGGVGGEWAACSW